MLAKTRIIEINGRTYGQTIYIDIGESCPEEFDLPLLKVDEDGECDCDDCEACWKNAFKDIIDFKLTWIPKR